MVWQTGNLAAECLHRSALRHGRGVLLIHQDSTNVSLKCSASKLEPVNPQCDREGRGHLREMKLDLANAALRVHRCRCARDRKSIGDQLRGGFVEDLHWVVRWILTHENAID